MYILENIETGEITKTNTLYYYQDILYQYNIYTTQYDYNFKEYYIKDNKRIYL